MATHPIVVELGSCSDRQAPHFFKVVMFPFEQGLKIPAAFMRRHGHDLQDTVLLKVPTGASWQVKLAHYGDRTLLQNGWEEFANYYSVKMFSFLVFRYEGNSRFHVLIFDPSALEIEYPVEINNDRHESYIRTSDHRNRSSARTKLNISDNHGKSAEILKRCYQKTPTSKGKRVRVEDTEEDDTVESFDDLLQCKPNTRSLPKMMKENPHSTGKINAAEADTKPCHHTKSNCNEKAKQHQDPSCLKQKMKKGKNLVGSGTMRPFHSPSSISSYKTVLDKEQFESSYAKAKAKAFTSLKPFFISVMKHSMVSKYFELQIPLAFSRCYLFMKKKPDFLLRVSGKFMSWPVRTRGWGRPGDGRKFSAGWKKFVQDNCLKLGDACVFELEPGTRNFNVTVYSSSADEMVL